MQMVKRIFGGFFLLLLFLWVFAPKQELYYLVEKELEKEGIIISNETFSDNGFGLIIHDADIYLQGIQIAQAKTLNFYAFFLYNKLSIEQTTTDEGIHNVAPKSIDRLTATYSILAPYKIAIEGQGSFGSIEGGFYFNLDNKLLIRFTTMKDVNAFRKFLKKDQIGVYYEKHFK